MSEPPIFRCPPAARWLGRALAAASVVGGFLASSRIHPAVAGSVWSGSRALVIGVGVVLGWLVLRGGARLHGSWVPEPEALVFVVGRRRSALPYEQIVSLSWEPPFVSRREWLPTMVLVDRFDKRWRVPSLLEDGRGFVAALLSAAGREDLSSFASAHALDDRMGHTRAWVFGGYALTLAVVAGSLWLALTGPV